MGHSDFYNILGYLVGLRYPSQAVANAFRHVLGGFLSPPPSPSVSPYDIHEAPHQGVYRIMKDGAILGDYASLSELVSRTEWAILKKAFEAMPYLGLHAGAVTRSGRCLLLPGDPGAGKTSLVLGLLLRGWGLLSDEAAPIHPDTSEVHPFPRTLCIKDGCLGKFHGVDRNAVLDRPGSVLDVGGVSCVASRAFDMLPLDRSAPVGAIVFPSYTRGAPASLVQIPRAKGLGLLMRHALNRRAFPDRALSILGKLADRARCFELHSGSLEAALDLLHDIN